MHTLLDAAAGACTPPGSPSASAATIAAASPPPPASPTAQVQHLQVLQPVPQLQLSVQDPQEVDVPSLLSIGGWLLQHNLASLRLGVVPVANNDLFYSLATLTNLTTLNLSLIEAPGCTRAFLNIACLSSLVKLEELAVSCTSKVLIPLTAKAVSVLALSWRALSALSLSLAGTPCVVPEALQLLDSFACLKSLAITSPVDLLDAQVGVLLGLGCIAVTAVPGAVPACLPACLGSSTEARQMHAPFPLRSNRRGITHAHSPGCPQAPTSLRSTRSQDLEVVLEEGRAASGALQRSSSIASSVWDLLSYSTSALVNVGSSALALTGITGPATPGGTPKAGSVPSSPRSMTSPLSRTSSRAPPISKLDHWLAQRQAEMEEYCPVYLDYLPSTLESLTLERAELLHHPPGPEGADGAPLEDPGTPAASADGQRPRKSIPQLRHLALDSCKLSDAGLAALLGHLTQLKSLELAELEGISDEGMAAVAAVGSLQELVVFALECKGITAASLKAACTCPQLAVLAWATSDLVGSLGDEELIPCLRRPAKLQRLMLYTQDDGVRDPEGALRRKFDWALPLVSVTYGPMEM